MLWERNLKCERLSHCNHIFQHEYTNESHEYKCYSFWLFVELQCIYFGLIILSVDDADICIFVLCFKLWIQSDYLPFISTTWFKGSIIMFVHVESQNMLETNGRHKGCVCLLVKVEINGIKAPWLQPPAKCYPLILRVRWVFWKVSKAIFST